MLTKPKIYTQNSKRQSHGFFWQAPEEPWLGLRRTAKALPTKEIYLGLHIGESRSRLVSVGRYALDSGFVSLPLGLAFVSNAKGNSGIAKKI